MEELEMHRYQCVECSQEWWTKQRIPTASCPKCESLAIVWTRPVKFLEWETQCPERPDRIHCTCWYDGGKCCGCGSPALPEDERKARGPHPVFGGGPNDD